MLRTLLLTTAAVAFMSAPASAAPAKTSTAAASATLPASNPFAKPSTLYLQTPDFSKIKDSDYLPAILAGMAQQKAERDRKRRSLAADGRQQRKSYFTRSRNGE